MKKLYTALVLTLFVLPLVAQTIPSYVPKDGLVGYWPFNGNANDESGNGNHGTVNGATLTADRNGKVNSAYYFNSKYLGHTDGADFIRCIKSGPIGKSSRSFSFWIKTDSLNISKLNNIVISYGGNEKNLNQQFRVTLGGSCVQSISAVTLGGNRDVTYKPNDTWDMVTVVFDSNIKSNCEGIKTYLNSVEINSYCSDIAGGELNTSELHPITFGSYHDLNWSNDRGFYKGQLDDITIYNRALSEQEIAQLYAGCTKETATSSNFNTLMYTTNAPVNLTATPTGGTFRGNGIANNAFNPSKAKLGKNTIKYNFKNTTGCADSTDFAMLVVDTVGATCTKFDTVKVNKYDTITITNKVTKYDTVLVNKTKFDTIIVKTNVFDTVKVTKYDTLTVKNNIYDTVKFTKFDTITITNNVTKYDTVIVNKTNYDTVTVKNNIYDTVKVTKYDTITITNNVTKYDTVIVNKTNYDTVSILKIKFKLTTGISANQLSSLSIYPNPTSDVLHIEVPDAKALEGYRYRIVDALGKEVYNQLVTQSATEIPLKTLGAAGIYQFEILDAKNASIQSNKIVLQ